MLERLTWEQMAAKYPDKWLALFNCRYDENNDATLIEADVFKVFDSWEDYYTFRDNNIGRGKIDYSINTRNNQRYIELRYDKEEYVTLAKYNRGTIDSVYVTATSDKI